MSASIIATGIRELDRKLSGLPDKVQKKIARSALQQALTIEVKAMKAAAPVGATGALKESISKRLGKNRRTGISEAKAGINVGKRTSRTTRRQAPHGHLVALGTQERFTSTGASRGIMPANEFIRRAAKSVESRVYQKMEDVIRTKLAREVAKK